MKNLQREAIPSEGKPIGFSGGELQVPDTPIIPFIEGTERGATFGKRHGACSDAAGGAAYGGSGDGWFEFSPAKRLSIPSRSGCRAIRGRDPRFRVAIKGPLTTPVGGGIRSLNVALRQILDLYSCDGRSAILRGAFSGARAGKNECLHLPGEYRRCVHRDRVEIRLARAKKLLEFLNNEM